MIVTLTTHRGLFGTKPIAINTDHILAMRPAGKHWTIITMVNKIRIEVKGSVEEIEALINGKQP